MKVSAGILGFALIWTLGVGYFNALSIQDIARQVRASGWPTVTGRITHSDVRSIRSTDGTTFHPDVRYTYQAGGGTHTSDQIRFLWSPSGSSDFAQEVTIRYPVGATVTVFHDPNDPTIAVLETGIDGSNLRLANILLVFNIAGLLLWWMGIGFERIPPRRGETIGSAWLFTDDDLLRLRLAIITPLMAGVFTLGLGCFLGAFVIEISTSGNPSIAAVVTAWSIIGALTLLVSGWRCMRLRAGVTDLVIDHARCVVTLPGMKPGDDPIPFAAILGIALRHPKMILSSDGSVPLYAHQVVLMHRDAHGAERMRTVGRRDRPEQARAIAEWLRTQLDAPAIDVIALIG